MSDLLRAELARIAAALGAPDVPFVVERPRDTGHGDLATNLALLVGKTHKANPRKVAEEVIAAVPLPAGPVSRTEIAGPGCNNFWPAQVARASHH